MSGESLATQQRNANPQWPVQTALVGSREEIIAAATANGKATTIGDNEGLLTEYVNKQLVASAEAKLTGEEVTSLIAAM